VTKDNYSLIVILQVSDNVHSMPSGVKNHSYLLVLMITMVIRPRIPIPSLELVLTSRHQGTILHNFLNSLKTTP
jgi:hypothetical protein